MLVFLIVLISIVSVLLVMIVLIQNPKGGGLGASFGGLSNSFMGVQRTTDILEKATWTLAILLLVFSLITKVFAGGQTITVNNESSEIEGMTNPGVQDQGGNTEAPFNNNQQ